MKDLKIIERAQRWPLRRAIVSGHQVFNYQQLLSRSAGIAQFLLHKQQDLKEARIAFLVEDGFDYVCTQWAIWRAGGIAVPLCTLHPLPALKHVLEDAEVSALIVSENFRSRMETLAGSKDLPLYCLGRLPDRVSRIRFPAIAGSRRAMILYTSGTTSKPKGVVSSHSNINFQISTLVEAWEWRSTDHILNVLPLHHVHGIINVVGCALWSGACITFLPKFDASTVWQHFLGGEINLFMAVPTVYHKLIEFWKEQDPPFHRSARAAAGQFRLFVSGSAALPPPVLEQWQKITGHTLLERYGMTEIGMALSNPYRGQRKAAHVGMPLPGIEIRLTDENNLPVGEGQAGEIQVRGPNVFLEYWQQPKATQNAFANGWFKTGDYAVFSDGSYKILGRRSVDIIKSGGYKISALEIENVLRQHPYIKDCAVVGIADAEWGEIIGAALVTERNSIDPEELKLWLKTLLPPYQVPRKFLELPALPRNTLGKVTKPELKKMFK